MKILTMPLLVNKKITADQFLKCHLTMDDHRHVFLSLRMQETARLWIIVLKKGESPNSSKTG